MIRLRVSKVILLIPADVPAFFVHRESKQLSTVADIVITRITELRVLSYPITRIHPMIIRLIDRRLIVPRRMRREVSLVFRQIHFHRPGCTGKPFIRKDITAHTAVIFFLYQIINRCTGSRRMTNDTKVKFDTTRCPRATHRYITEFGHAIVINKRLACCLVDCTPYLSSDFGEQGYLDIIVFQLDCFPFFIHSFSRKTIKPEIRIIQIGRRSHRTRIGERIAFHGFRLLFYHCLLSKNRRPCPKGTYRQNQHSFLHKLVFLRYS